MQNIKIAYSSKQNIIDAIDEVKSELTQFENKFLIFFASSSYDKDNISMLIKESFPTSGIIGCTTAGELVSGRTLKNSLVIMSFNSNIIEDYKVEVVENISKIDDINTTFFNIDKHFDQNMLNADNKKYFGITLFDGMSGCEEKIADMIGSKTDILMIGGSAGDDCKFEKTYLYFNGKSYEDAALIAVFKSKVKFDFIKTQSFKTLNKKLIATKVDEKNRDVIEFNNQNAVNAYAEAVGVDIENAEKMFFKNPIGIVVEDEIFVRSPQIIKDNRIHFYCNIIEGAEVDLLESTNIINDTKIALLEKQKKGKIQGIINFNCILRTLELEQNNQMEEYANIFKDIPTVGFSTYGEFYLGHINQTATMLVFYE